MESKLEETNTDDNSIEAASSSNNSHPGSVNLDDSSKLHSYLKARFGDLAKMEKNIYAINTSLAALPDVLNKLITTSSNPEIERSLNSLLKIMEGTASLLENLPVKELKESIGPLTKKISALNTGLPPQIGEIKEDINKLSTIFLSLQQTNSTIAASQVELKANLKNELIHEIKTSFPFRTTSKLELTFFLIIAIGFVVMVYQIHTINNRLYTIETSLQKPIQMAAPGVSNSKANLEGKEDKKVQKSKK